MVGVSENVKWEPNLTLQLSRVKERMASRLKFMEAIAGARLGGATDTEVAKIQDAEYVFNLSGAVEFPEEFEKWR